MSMGTEDAKSRRAGTREAMQAPASMRANAPNPRHPCVDSTPTEKQKDHAIA